MKSIAGRNATAAVAGAIVGDVPRGAFRTQAPTYRLAAVGQDAEAVLRLSLVHDNTPAEVARIIDALDTILA